LRATDVAERIPGHATNYLAKRANDFGTHIVFGLVIKEKVESILYNGVVCVGPEGSVVAEYRKVHLLGEERQVYRNGFRFVTVEAEWGRFGMLVGIDLAFPEAARSLTLDGAELIAISANWDEQNKGNVARVFDQSGLRECCVRGSCEPRRRGTHTALCRG
jgi:omega-amidase